MPKELPTVRRARKLRREMSKPEVMLWQSLRADPQGVRFRRQHPVGPFVLDFYCPKAKLAIEVDGIAHDMGDQPEFDIKRDAWLANEGIEILRIPAIDVLRHSVGSPIPSFALPCRGVVDPSTTPAAPSRSPSPKLCFREDNTAPALCSCRSPCVMPAECTGRRSSARADLSEGLDQPHGTQR